MNEVIGQARDKGSEEFTVNLTSELIDGEGDPDKTKSVRDACLVHIYPTGAGMGTRYPIAEQPLTIGRSSDCQIRIGDNSVSRHHVRINVGKLGHQFRDLESTNGTLVNNRRVPGGRLRDGDYLRVGNHIFRYLAGGMPGSTVSTQACFTINNPEQVWLNALPGQCAALHGLSGALIEG